MLEKNNNLFTNYDDLFSLLMLYDTKNNRDMLEWIYNNKKDVLSVMNCVGDTGIDRKIVNRFFNDLENKNILTSINIEELKDKNKFLRENNFNNKTRKAYVIRRKGIDKFIDDWLETVDKIIWWFL